jgi:hypothetical protein
MVWLLHYFGKPHTNYSTFDTVTADMVSAGKISEEPISAGFKHATLLVMMAILAAKLLPISTKI